MSIHINTRITIPTKVVMATPIRSFELRATRFADSINLRIELSHTSFIFGTKIVELVADNFDIAHDQLPLFDMYSISDSRADVNS